MEVRLRGHIYYVLGAGYLGSDFTSNLFFIILIFSMWQMRTSILGGTGRVDQDHTVNERLCFVKII